MFENLLDEIIFEVALRLTLKSLYNLINSNKRLFRLFLKDSYFWRCKCNQDFSKTIREIKSWEDYKALCLPIFTFGQNNLGQLGLGDTNNRKNPTRVYSLFHIADVSVGKDYTLVLDIEGTVWTFGSSQYGIIKLKDFPIQPILTPMPIQGPAVKKISAGYNHFLVITTDSSVWATGYNSDGQLGLGDYLTRRTLTQIPNLQGRDVSAGGDHSIVADPSGRVWTFGSNKHGQLGLGNCVSRNTPCQITSLPCGQDYTVCAGMLHTVIISSSGTVWTFGYNGNGQLGFGDFISRNIPTRLNIRGKFASARLDHTVIADPDHSVVWAFGNIRLGLLTSNTPVPIHIKAQSVAAGAYHTVITDTEGAVWAFGDNTFGQLGLGDHDPRNVLTRIPNLQGRIVSAGWAHTAIIGI